MRDICDRHGALLILDEVMCGMGRTGTLHAWEQEGVAPDIQAIAKGLGGGYQPIGAMLAYARIIDALRGFGSLPARPYLHGTPAGLCGCLEVQRVIRMTCWNGCKTGERLERRLTERFGNHRHVGDIRGRGLFRAIELVAERATKDPSILT